MSLVQQLLSGQSEFVAFSNNKKNICFLKVFNTFPQPGFSSVFYFCVMSLKQSTQHFHTNPTQLAPFLQPNPTQFSTANASIPMRDALHSWGEK